ncbi:MAG TPA: hypothetical protein VK507_06735, partial [Iamia sp.]|nr:hypothetical protein [Iamia sp.]
PPDRVDLGLRQQIAALVHVVGATPAELEDPVTLLGSIGAADDAVADIEETADTALRTLQTVITDLTAKSTRDAEGLADGFLAEAERNLFDLRGRLQSVYGTLAEPTRDLDANAAQTGVALEDIAEEVRTTIAGLTGQTNTELAATTRNLDRSSVAVYRNLTGSETPNVAQSALAGGGFQGLLRGQLADLATEELALESTMDDTASFRGIRHTRYVARLVRQAQQQAGQDRLGGTSPFDGEVEDGSVVGTVFVFRFEEVG